MPDTPSDPDPLFVLELKPGPDRSQRRRGMPDRDPYLRLRRVIKTAARECGFHVRWAKLPLPAGVVLAEPEPDEGE